MTSNTKKTLGAIGVGIVIVAVPSVLAFLDMGKISDIEAETAKHDKDANELKKKQKDLEPLRGATAAEMVTFLRKKNSLPTGREADEFVDKLAEFRQKAGIPPWEISKTQTRQQTGRGGAAAEAAGGDAIEEYKYSIKMSAQYHQLGYLLSQIEYWDRFIRVAAIKVTGGGQAKFNSELVRNLPSVREGEEFKVLREGDARDLKPEEIALLPDATREEFGNGQLDVSIDLVTYFYPEVRAQPIAAPPKPAKPAPKGAAAGAAPAVDPEQRAALEAALLEEATVEAESGDAESAKQKLDRFLWPVEENAGIRNPFNPLEALTPKAIDPGEGPEIKADSLPLTEAERVEVDALVLDAVGKKLGYVKDRVDLARDFLGGGSQDDLLNAMKCLEDIKAPTFDKKSALQRAEEILKNPYQLLAEIIARRNAAIRDKLVYTELSKQVDARKLEVEQLERDLDKKRIEIALALSQRVYEKMVDQLDRHQYKEVRTTFEKEMKPLASKSSMVAGVREYVEKAEVLDKQAGVRLEFFDLDMKMTAIVYDADSPEKSVFMIGGDHKPRAIGELFDVGKEKAPVRILSMGASETVDESGGVVSTYDLVVEYKGEKIPVRQLSHASELQQDLEDGKAVDGKKDSKGGGKKPPK